MARNVCARCYPETDHRQDLPVGRGGPVEFADEGAIVHANARRHALVLTGAVPAAGGEGNAGLGRFPARSENQDRITALRALAKQSKTSDRVSQPHFDLVVEKDLEIPMRDGARLRADVFRPKSAGRFPAIINLGSYQKDKLWVPPPDLEEKPNEFMNWETVNPL